MKLLTIAALIISGASTTAVALDRDRNDDEGDPGWARHRPMVDFAMAAGPMRWVGASAAHRWEELDTDEDGRVSRDEYMDAKASRFEELDADEDGFIGEDELEEFIGARVEQRMETFHQRRQGKHKMMENMDMEMDDLEELLEGAMDQVEIVIKGVEGPGFLRLDERMDRRFEGLDKNEDGEITREEFLARRDQAFDRMDENGDGIISEEELEEGAERFMGERMGRPRHFRFRSH